MNSIINRVRNIVGSFLIKIGSLIVVKHEVTQTVIDKNSRIVKGYEK